MLFINHLFNLNDMLVSVLLFVLQVGMTVHCRIMKIDIEKFSVDLTCRTSDLMDKNNEWKLPKDTYYDFDTEAEDQKHDEELKKKQQRTR